MDVEQAIRRRRTHKAFPSEPVPRETARRAARAGALGPEPPPHEPVAIPGARAGRSRAAQAGGGARGGGEARPRADAGRGDRGTSGDPVQDEEDLCATACATYAVLLAAHARGLAGYWRTPGVLRTPPAAPHWGSGGGERFVALIHLGGRVRRSSRRSGRRAAPSSDTWTDERADLRRAAGGDSREGLLVLHHGRGTSELDLLPLADVLDPERRLHVVAPRGPFRIRGVPGNHWYAVMRVGYPDPETFLVVYAALAAFHDESWRGRGSGPIGPCSAASRWAR